MKTFALLLLLTYPFTLIAWGRPTPTQPTAVAHPGAIPTLIPTSPIIPPVNPAPPRPGPRFAYGRILASCTARAGGPSYNARLESTASTTPAATLHIVPGVDPSRPTDASRDDACNVIPDVNPPKAEQQDTTLPVTSAPDPVPPEGGSGKIVPASSRDHVVAAINASGDLSAIIAAAAPTRHAGSTGAAADAAAAPSSNTAHDTLQSAARVMTGWRWTILAAVPPAETGTPKTLPPGHPPLPKMIGYSVLLLGTSSPRPLRARDARRSSPRPAALFIFLYLLFYSKRISFTTLRPRGRRAQQRMLLSFAPRHSSSTHATFPVA